MRAAESAPLEVQLWWAMEHDAPVAQWHEHAQWYEHLLRSEPHAMDYHRTFKVRSSVNVESLHKLSSPNMLPGPCWLTE